MLDHPVTAGRAPPIYRHAQKIITEAGIIGSLGAPLDHHKVMLPVRRGLIFESAKRMGCLRRAVYSCGASRTTFTFARANQQATCQAAQSNQENRRNVLSATLSHIPLAVDALEKGGVVAVPTDTIYGLAADSRSAAGVQAVYAAKGRSFDKPLAIACGEVADVMRVADTSHLPPAVLPSLLPGAVTLLLPVGPSASLSPLLTSRLLLSRDSSRLVIGVRVPDSLFVRALASALKAPLALTSANVSGATSAVTVGEFSDLWPKCRFVFDGGSLPADRRVGSTIVNLTKRGVFSIIREGSCCAGVRRVLAGLGLREEEEED